MSAAEARARKSNPTVQKLLAYLQHHLPDYPFESALDAAFVEEIVTDFAEQVDVLEETKSFRWFHNNQPVTQLRHVRLALRRWIANATTRRAR